MANFGHHHQQLHPRFSSNNASAGSAPPNGGGSAPRHRPDAGDWRVIQAQLGHPLRASASSVNSGGGGNTGESAQRKSGLGLALGLGGGGLGGGGLGGGGLGGGGLGNFGLGFDHLDTIESLERANLAALQRHRVALAAGGGGGGARTLPFASSSSSSSPRHPHHYQQQHQQQRQQPQLPPFRATPSSPSSRQLRMSAAAASSSSSSFCAGAPTSAPPTTAEEAAAAAAAAYGAAARALAIARDAERYHHLLVVASRRSGGAGASSPSVDGDGAHALSPRLGPSGMAAAAAVTAADERSFLEHNFNDRLSSSSSGLGAMFTSRQHGGSPNDFIMPQGSLIDSVAESRARWPLHQHLQASSNKGMSSASTLAFASPATAAASSPFGGVSPTAESARLLLQRKKRYFSPPTVMLARGEGGGGDEVSAFAAMRASAASSVGDNVARNDNDAAVYAGAHETDNDDEEKDEKAQVETKARVRLAKGTAATLSPFARPTPSPSPLAPEGRDFTPGTAAASSIPSVSGVATDQFDARAESSSHVDDSGHDGKTDAAKAGSEESKKDATEESTKKRKRKPYKKKPTDMPRRPLSAYNLFFSDERDRILLSLASSDDDREETESAYLPSADDVFSKEGDTAVDGAADATSESSQQPRQPRVLSRPLSRIPGRRRPHRRTHGKIGFKDLAKTIASRWKELSSERMAYYRGLAREDRERHGAAMREYHDRKRVEAAEAEKEAQEQEDVAAISSPPLPPLPPPSTENTKEALAAMGESTEESEEDLARREFKRLRVETNNSPSNHVSTLESEVPKGGEGGGLLALAATACALGESRPPSREDGLSVPAPAADPAAAAAYAAAAIELYSSSAAARGVDKKNDSDRDGLEKGNLKVGDSPPAFRTDGTSPGGWFSEDCKKQTHPHAA